ncbi:hypothetical protein Q1695_009821 [Nippostrongylus brasiliensis]|nr:hypothetical protein Q1695_009821 [Nippostrongylus brasiliensis]
MGRNLMEERIMNEFNITCESIDRRLVTGKKIPIEAHATFDLLVGNIINGLLFTDRFEKKDEETFLELKSRMDEMMENFTFSNMLIVDDEMLVMSVLDLWIAAQATTSTTLSWAFTFLLLHPDVRSRVEQELFSVTKGQRPLSYSDKPSNPYFNATITDTEIHRCASLTPLNLWRDTAEDTAVGPYVIPKGTAITAQLSLVMNDEKFFEDRHQEGTNTYY